MKLDWEPKAFKTSCGAAKALYRALCKKCEQCGGDPAHEVWIKSPEESEAHGYVGKVWHVCWESGPYNWGCEVFADGPWGHCETYWGFDLAFYS
jgi:hypothetical protein